MATGVLVIAFFTGPAFSPVNHHRAFHTGHAYSDMEHVTWIKGTFLKLFGDMAWSLWIVFQGFAVSGLSYFMQVWCVEMKGPVFFAVWMPLGFIFTMFCSSFFLGEIIHLGSIMGGILLVGGLYSVLWAKSKETIDEPACSEVDTVESTHDKKEHIKLRENLEKGREEKEEETLTYEIHQL